MPNINELITTASSRDEAMERLRNAKLKEPKEGTNSGVGYNAYEFVRTGNEKFFDKVEEYYVKQTQREKDPRPDFYATREGGGKPTYAEVAAPKTSALRGRKPSTSSSSSSEEEEEEKEEKRPDTEASTIEKETRQSVDELSDLMGQINKLKQDEADLKTEIDRSPTDEKREELKRNLGVVIEKRRAVEETAQMTLDEVRTAPEKMQKVDPSKVEAIEEMAKEAEEMGGDRPPKDEPKQTVEVDPTMAEAMPTMSPDQREDMRKEQEEADRKAKEEEEERVRVRRELGEREARRREQPLTEPTKGKDGPKMTITRSKASTVPDDIQALPMERISTRNKNLAQLLDDLKYFFNTYPDTLRRDTEKYEQLDKMSMPLVERFHKMIVGKLYDPEKSKKRVGIILDAREYIAQQVNEILAKRATDGLKPEEIVSITDPEKKSDAKDFGNYEVKEGRQGGVQFLRREPLYRLMPETNDKNVYPMEAKAKKGRLRVGPPPTRYNSLVQNAKLEFKQNPFTEPKKDIVRLQF